MLRESRNIDVTNKTLAGSAAPVMIAMVTSSNSDDIARQRVNDLGRGAPPGASATA
jgi:hypothetical protein